MLLTTRRAPLASQCNYSSHLILIPPAPLPSPFFLLLFPCPNPTAEMESQVQALVGTLERMPSVVEAVSRVGSPSLKGSRPSTGQRGSPSASAAGSGSSTLAPSNGTGNFALGQMAEKPLARHVPLGSGSPAAAGPNKPSHHDNTQCPIV